MTTPREASHGIVDSALLTDCVHCGLCLESCPTYAITRSEMDSPRGRIHLMKSIAQGEMALDGDAVRHLDLCLGCRGCESACPSGVHYSRMIEQARAFVEFRYRRRLAERLRRAVIGSIFPYPARLRMVLAPIRLIERAGLRNYLDKIIPRGLREWLGLLPPLTGEHRETIDTRAAGADPAQHTAVMHHGCVAQVLGASENRSIERLLRAAGLRVAGLNETVCCGALDLHSGRMERALEFARANVRALKVTGDSPILSAAAGCAATIAEYGELLRGEPELAGDAASVSARVRDLSTVLQEAGFSSFGTLKCTVTYHDSCHLAHGLGIREAPRTILRSIPGVELVEMAESDLCCGSAGTYNLTQTEMARVLAARKADNIAATGTDYVVMCNTGCVFQIAAELRRRGAKTRAIHLADFLALAMESGPAKPA